jgi:hypothetical protein
MRLMSLRSSPSTYRGGRTGGWTGGWTGCGAPSDDTEVAMLSRQQLGVHAPALRPPPPSRIPHLWLLTSPAINADPATPSLPYTSSYLVARGFHPATSCLSIIYLQPAPCFPTHHTLLHHLVVCTASAIDRLLHLHHASSVSPQQELAASRSSGL